MKNNILTGSLYTAGILLPQHERQPRVAGRRAAHCARGALLLHQRRPFFHARHVPRAPAGDGGGAAPATDCLSRRQLHRRPLWPLRHPARLGP